MDKLTPAQQAIQDVRDKNSHNVATIEINGVKYDVVYKNDEGEFCDLTGLDEEVKALASAVLSAHKISDPKSLVSREISHIDTAGVHYTNKPDEAHESVKLDAEGFKTLDNHLGLTSTIESVADIYRAAENLEEGKIDYEAVLNSLPPDLKSKVEAAIGSDKSKENLLKKLDLCANSYLCEKLDISSGPSAPKEAIVHSIENPNQINKAASLQAFKEAATAKDAWDAMNETIAKTHHAAAKASMPSSSSLLSGLTLAPRLDSTKHKERAKRPGKNLPYRKNRNKTKEASGNLSSPQPTPTSTSLGSPSKRSSYSQPSEDDSGDEGYPVLTSDPKTIPTGQRKTERNTLANGAGFNPPQTSFLNSPSLAHTHPQSGSEGHYFPGSYSNGSYIEADENFFSSPSFPTTSPVTPRKSASLSGESLVTRSLSSKSKASSHSGQPTLTNTPHKPLTVSSFLSSSGEEIDDGRFHTPVGTSPTSPEKTLSPASGTLPNGLSIVARQEDERRDDALSPPVKDDGISGNTDIAVDHAPATSKPMVDQELKFTSPISSSSPAREEKHLTTYAELALIKETASRREGYNPTYVPEDTKAAKKNISKFYFGTELLYLGINDKNYLYNLMGQVEKEGIKSEKLKMKRLKQLLEV